MKILILSCGAVASDVAHRLLAAEPGLELTVADLDGERAAELAAELGLPAGHGRRVDVSEPDSLSALLDGTDLVFNGVGPYYRFGLTVARAAVAAGAHYVDICDEYDVARAIVTDTELDAEAQRRGLTVMTGMGSSPGLSNLLGAWVVNQLDEVDTLDFVLGLPLIVDLGTTINAHMLHSLSGTVTQWADGEYVEVPAWSDPREIELLGRGGRHAFSCWGHPEAVTLPRYFPHVRRATSRFSWFHPEGNDLYQALDRWGFASDDAVAGVDVTPRRLTAALMSSDRGRDAMSVDWRGMAPVNVWHVAASGTKDGVGTQVVIEAELDLAAERPAGGAALTAIPATLGLLALVRGDITRRGVVAPEACLDPEPIIREAYTAMGGITVTRRITTTDQLI